MVKVAVLAPYARRQKCAGAAPCPDGHAASDCAFATECAGVNLHRTGTSAGVASVSDQQCARR